MSRQNLEAYVGWFRAIPWQLFCTFTFAWRVSDAQAIAVFKAFIDRVESLLRCPITYLRGDEKRFSGCGKPGAPRHFHVLMASARSLEAVFIKELWMKMAGRREHGAGADVREYDPMQGGVAYVLKSIEQPNGDWDLRNVDLFLALQKMSRRQRRRLRRNVARTVDAVQPGATRSAPAHDNRNRG